MTEAQLFPMHEMAPDEMDSVDDFLDAHPEFLVPYADLSIVSMKVNYKHFSAFLISRGVTLGQVDQKTVIAYQNHINASGLSVGTYCQKISHVRTLLKYIGKHFIYKNRKRTPYANARIIDEDDFKKMLVYIHSKLRKTKDRYYLKYLRDYIMFKLFYMTGLRKFEIRSLRHQDVYEEQGETFYQVIVKGGTQIKKQFPKGLNPYLRELKSLEEKGESDFIFTGDKHRPTKDGRLVEHSINDRLNVYYDKAIKKGGRVTVHGIRNISGLACQKESQDIYNTQAHLNHARLITTVNYLEQITRRTRTPLDKLERRLGI